LACSPTELAAFFTSRTMTAVLKSRNGISCSTGQSSENTRMLS